MQRVVDFDIYKTDVIYFLEVVSSVRDSNSLVKAPDLVGLF